MDFPNDLVTLGIQGHANMMYSSTWHHKAAQQRGTQSSPHVPAEDPPASEPLPSTESQPWAESQHEKGVIYICSPSQRIRICGLFLQEEGLLVSESTQAAQKTTVLVIVHHHCSPAWAKRLHHLEDETASKSQALQAKPERNVRIWS